MVEQMLCKHKVASPILAVSKMKHLIIKDQRRRVLYNLFEKRRIFLNTLLQNKGFSKAFRVLVFKEFLYLPKDSSITRIRNRCVLTGRPRAVYRKLGLSRLMIRKYLWRGALIGFRNSS